ncbi:MAG TPA: SCP2 sterol-binding domain-containing protein, partial [Solirubrobacteraceae bacterium]|nr:SCP2 sterol-binding domain-containing protein [Solirubrobacteraceae bacterium]
ARYEQAGVDQMIFVLQAGNNRHEHICEALELFAREVMPEFHERAEERERAKAERLAPAVEAALARREPAREGDPGYVIGPLDSGPPAGTVGAGRAATAPADGRAFAPKLAELGEQAFGAFVRRSDDRRLERVVGSDLGLRVLFTGMAQRFVPERANGFEGELQYELRADGGAVKRWVVAVERGQARARPGAAESPRLTIRMGLADFARLAGQDLDPGKALLTGRMDLDGDLSVAPRLGEMFGQEPAL